MTRTDLIAILADIIVDDNYNKIEGHITLTCDNGELVTKDFTITESEISVDDSSLDFDFLTDDDDDDEYYDFGFLTDDDDDEDCDDYYDDVDECGFNPYMGCYDYDC